MSTTPMGKEQDSNEQATKGPSAGTVETKLELIVLPVADVDRARRFYEGLGWRLDADFSTGENFRVVQLTPPGSPGSIIFGKGITTAAPGSVQGLCLVVTDIAAARAERVARGVDVSEVFHDADGVFLHAGTQGRVNGPDPEGRSYRSFLSFRDPDGNGWILQEIKTRLPGRGLRLDVATLTDLLREAEARHGAFEAVAPKHHWSGWYARYVLARERGKTPDEASTAASKEMSTALEKVSS